MDAIAVTELAARFGVNDENLAFRRLFIRLGQDERQGLLALIPWIEEHSPDIAREFYDWQFSFPGTRSFFERFCASRNMGMDQLRERLEKEQANYLRQIFYGARDDWGMDYFESRLKIGQIHDRINLPFKWYVGSYVEWERLIRKRLRAEHGVKTGGLFRRSDGVMNWETAVQAVGKVFNFDIQAVGDSFLLSLLDSMGLSVESFDADGESDRTERLDQGKRAIDLLLRQAEAIARGELVDESLKEAVPGRLGESFGKMASELTSFIREVGGSSQRLASASEGLSAVSRELEGNARQSVNLAESVSSISEQVSENAQSVSGSVDELGSSINEIATNADEASRVADSAVEAVDSAKVVIGKLGDSSREIGEVIGVITAIAQQTNLLSLNAAIEAARAGEAGKGFAVVATEVKELARETEKATEEISQKIENTRNFVAQAVSAVDEIGNIIETIHDIQSSIAGAVAQQNATTQEIGVSMKTLVDDNAGIADKSRTLSAAAKGSSAEAERVQAAAAELAQMGGELQALIGRFII